MRVVRILVYEGDEAWIRNVIDRNGVKGRMDAGSGRSITEVFVGLAFEQHTVEELKG